MQGHIAALENGVITPQKIEHGITQQFHVWVSSQKKGKHGVMQIFVHIIKSGNNSNAC